MTNHVRNMLDTAAIVEAGRAKRADALSLPAANPRINRGNSQSVATWTTTYRNYDLKVVLLVSDTMHEVSLSCTCKDWFASGGAYETDGSRNTRPCKHLLAFTEQCAVPYLHGTHVRPVTVQPISKGSGSNASSTTTPVADFPGTVSAQIGSAIESLSLEIEEILMDGQVPLVIGPTGCGKTSAHRMIALRRGTSLVEHAGAASYSDADMVGIVHVNGQPFPGPIADAFGAAREMGDDVLLFLDEFTRYNARAQEALMRPLLPIPADAARTMGIDTDVPVRVTSAPFWGTEWGPADKIKMSLACNPWGTAIDPALIRRTVPVYADFPNELAELFSEKMGKAILASWNAVRDGLWPLPIEYQALSRAQSEADTSVFRTYSFRLRALDPAAADGFAAVLQGLGLT